MNNHSNALQSGEVSKPSWTALASLNTFITKALSLKNTSQYIEKYLDITYLQAMEKSEHTKCLVSNVSKQQTLENQLVVIGAQVLSDNL